MIAECVDEYTTPQVLAAYRRVKEVRVKDPNQLRQATGCLTEAVKRTCGTLPLSFVALNLGTPGLGRDGSVTFPEQYYSAGSVIKIEGEEVPLSFRLSALRVQRQEEQQALMKTGGKDPLLLLPEGYVIPIYRGRQIAHWVPEYPASPALLRPRITALRDARWIRADSAGQYISTIRNAQIL